MKLSLATLACLIALRPSSTFAQQVVRITDPSAINPAEVSIAINPKNPDNMIAASFQIGQPPKPRAGSSHYVTFDGGKTWKTVPTPNPTNLVQGDDIVVFSSDGIAYHVHLSFEGIRLARPARAENGIIVNVSKDGGNTWVLIDQWQLTQLIDQRKTRVVSLDAYLSADFGLRFLAGDLLGGNVYIDDVEVRETLVSTTTTTAPPGPTPRFTFGPVSGTGAGRALAGSACVADDVRRVFLTRPREVVGELRRALGLGLLGLDRVETAGRRIERLKSTLDIAQSFARDRETQPLLELWKKPFRTEAMPGGETLYHVAPPSYVRTT